MAGRAGRRGLDSTGTVIIVANNCDSPMPTDLQLQQMLLGQATKLTSRFKVTYSMILYLHRGNLQTPQVSPPPSPLDCSPTNPGITDVYSN